MKEIVINAILDELEKMSQSQGVADYLQKRNGVRPIRVQTLLNKGYDVPADSDLIDLDYIAGDKYAETNSEDWKDTFNDAKPYVISGAKGAVPGALLGKVFPGKAGVIAPIVGATLGAGLGVANQFLEKEKDHKSRSKNNV